jgi:GT2 family glycosyltransferase
LEYWSSLPPRRRESQGSITATASVRSVVYSIHITSNLRSFLWHFEWFFKRFSDFNQKARFYWNFIAYCSHENLLETFMKLYWTYVWNLLSKFATIKVEQWTLFFKGVLNAKTGHFFLIVIIHFNFSTGLVYCHLRKISPETGS